MSEIEVTEENKSIVNSRTCFYFTCNSCGKIVHRKGQHFDGRLLCQDCKKKDTFMKKYGVDNPAKSPEIQAKMSESIKESFKKNNSVEKIKETSLKKYGTTNPGQSKEAKEKRKKTIEERYTENPLCRKDVIEKRKKTCLEKYGVEFPLSSKELQKDISRNQFTSENNPMHDDESIQKRKNTINKKYNGEVLANSEIREKIKETIKEHYNEKEQNTIQLLDDTIEFPFPNQDLSDTSDRGIILHFHKSIYYANRDKKKSPFEAWKDKNLVLKSALNRLKYIGRCEPKDILAGLNIARIAPKVSVFSPYLATNLIKKYLNNYNEVFDPFSGFSGRLIGAMNNNKVYIGQDLNTLHVEESNNLIKYKDYQNCKVTQKDIFEDSGSYECLFTCPPYNDKEHWNEDDKNLSCDEWIDICLERYKCKSYLFVVDHTEKYKDFIKEDIVNKSHLNENTEKVILIEKIEV